MRNREELRGKIQERQFAANTAAKRSSREKVVSKKGKGACSYKTKGKRANLEREKEKAGLGPPTTKKKKTPRVDFHHYPVACLATLTRSSAKEPGGFRPSKPPPQTDIQATLFSCQINQHPRNNQPRVKIPRREQNKTYRHIAFFAEGCSRSAAEALPKMKLAVRQGNAITEINRPAESAL